MLCGTISNSTKLIPLNEFLTNHKVDKAPISHTSMNGGKYYIPEDKNNEFLEIYNHEILEGNKPCYLVERHSEYGPLVIDIDIKYKTDNSKRGYTIEVLEKIMQIYMKYIEKYITIDDTNRNGFILEKKKPTLIEKDQEYKDGVHIFFPDIITKPQIQELIREKVIDCISKTDLFNYIDNTNDLQDIFDKSVIKSNGMFLYGSMKPNQKRPYKLTHIYKVYSNKIEYINNTLTPKEILFKLSLRKTAKQASYMMIDDEDIEKLLPNTKGKTDIKCNKEVNVQKIMNKQEENVIKDDVKENKSTNIIQFIGDIDLATENINKIKFSIKLVDLLKDDRVEEYKSWYNLGICLHNISSNLPIHKEQIEEWNKYSHNKTPRQLLLDKWIEKSNKSSKYRNGECEKLWDKMNYMAGGLTYYTLRYWAKEDNLYSYNKLCKNSVDVELPKVLSYKKGNVPSYELARIVHLCYADEFVCSSIKHRIWYKFDNHKWSKSDTGTHLRKLLSTQVRALFIQYRHEYSKANQEAELNNDSIKAKIYLEQMKNCISISEKLSTTAYKTSVMTELHDLFYNGEFDEKLDSNVNLMAFDNGVYDLEHGSFRPGLPEDYLSFTTGINYIPYNPDNQLVLDIYTFLSQILPKTAVREYVITTLSSFLSGKTSDEKFHIWTGSGGNGKSKLIELFSMCLGDYKTNLPISLLTQKRGASSSASPELSKTKGKRFGCLQEPDHNEKINVGLMKELTGGDMIEARALYSEPIEFKPQFKLILTCNSLPEMPAEDEGTWRRVRLVEFISKFVKEPNPKNQWEFPIDTELTTKLSLWKESFMSILVHYFINVYKKQGLNEPDEVLEVTNNYKKVNDFYSEFIDTVIIENPKGKLNVQNAGRLFKNWFKESGCQAPMPRPKKFNEYMNKRYGKPCTKDSCWKGICVKKEVENEIIEEDE